MIIKFNSASATQQLDDAAGFRRGAINRNQGSIQECGFDCADERLLVCTIRFKCGAGACFACRIAATIFSTGDDFSRKPLAPLFNARFLDSLSDKLVNIKIWVLRDSALIGRIASRPLASPIWISSRMASGPGLLASALNTAFGEGNTAVQRNSSVSASNSSMELRIFLLSSTNQTLMGDDSGSAFDSQTGLMAGSDMVKLSSKALLSCLHAKPNYIATCQNT